MIVLLLQLPLPSLALGAAILGLFAWGVEIGKRIAQWMEVNL